VKLKHIDSLWKILRDFTVIDPFVNIHPKYREPLDTKSLEVVQQAAEHFDRVLLLPVFKEFLIGQLTEETFNAKESIKNTIGFLEVADAYLNDLPWFATYFPPDLANKNILDVYKVIEGT